MTPIPPAAAYTPSQLAARDVLVMIATMFMLIPWVFVVHVSADDPIPERRIVMTADAIYVAEYVCRKNDGILHITPQSQKNTVTFQCRDGAKFTDTVMRLR